MSQGAQQPDRAGRMSSARAAVLARLRQLGGSATVRELAADLGQHPNTVREHLLALADALLVLPVEAEPGRRGRPAQRYRANPARRGSEREYAQLAAVLAQHLADLPDASETARGIGHGWGQRLVTRDGAPEPLTVLDQMGFEPEVDEDEWRLHRCPLIEAAQAYPSVICSVHLGMLESLVAARGLSPDDVELTPFAESGVCLVRVNRPVLVEGPGLRSTG